MIRVEHGGAPRPAPAPAPAPAPPYVPPAPPNPPAPYAPRRDWTGYVLAALATAFVLFMLWVAVRVFSGTLPGPMPEPSSDVAARFGSLYAAEPQVYEGIGADIDARHINTQNEIHDRLAANSHELSSALNGAMKGNVDDKGNITDSGRAALSRTFGDIGRAMKRARPR